METKAEIKAGTLAEQVDLKVEATMVGSMEESSEAARATVVPVGSKVEADEVGVEKGVLAMGEGGAIVAAKTVESKVESGAQAAREAVARAGVKEDARVAVVMAVARAVENSEEAKVGFPNDSRAAWGPLGK